MAAPTPPTITISPAAAQVAGCSASCTISGPTIDLSGNELYECSFAATAHGNYNFVRFTWRQSEIVYHKTDGTTTDESFDISTSNNPTDPASNSANIGVSESRYTKTTWDVLNVTAYFEEIPTTYTITTASSPVGGGTTTGDGTYSVGASCTITATPAAGYTFVRWEKNGSQVSTDASYTFTVSESATYTAVFSNDVVTITLVAHNGWGKVAFAGETPTTETVSKTVAAGTSLTIEASKTGANTADFTYWVGNPGGVQSANPLTITPLVNVTYEAYFRYWVTAYVAQLSDPTTPLPVGQVRITRDGYTGLWRNKTTYQVVDSNTITVEQRSLGGGWTFVKWRWRRTYEISWIEATPSYPSITLPTDNLEVVALFERTPTHLLVNSSTKENPAKLVYDPATNKLVADF